MGSEDAEGEFGTFAQTVLELEERSLVRVLGFLVEMDVAMCVHAQAET